MLVKIMDEMDLACLKSVVDKFDDLIGDISVIKGTLIAENKETDIDGDLAEAKGIVCSDRARLDIVKDTGVYPAIISLKMFD